MATTKKTNKKTEGKPVVKPVSKLAVEEKAQKEEIKKEEEAAVAAKSPIVSFTVWYTMRQSKIPAVHKKSIIKADFDARGLKEDEPMEVFDSALKKYGININN